MEPRHCDEDEEVDVEDGVSSSQNDLGTEKGYFGETPPHRADDEADALHFIRIFLPKQEYGIEGW